MHDELATVADTLGRDIIVVGPDAVTGPMTADDQLRVLEAEAIDGFEGGIDDIGVLVVAVDTPETAAIVSRAADCTEAFLVAVCSAADSSHIDPSLLDGVRNAVDVTLFASRDRSTVNTPTDHGGGTDTSPAALAVGGAVTFARMLHRAGHINLDLADARTVLTDGSAAVLARGAASLRTERTECAVHRAFDRIPSAIEIRRKSNVLLSVVGGPSMSITDAVTAVQTVRDEIGTVDEIIWGVATDESLGEQVTVDIVIDDVAYRPSLSAGDPCRRCGETLSAYTLGDRTTIACQACGFAGLSMSLDK